MMPRMLCTDCGSMGVADTVLEGSDRLEFAGWLLGGLPGWLYCAWRHQLRAKVCGICGSSALMRESRAQAAQHAPPVFGALRSRVSNRSGPSSWPEGLREPRRRLRLGGVWLAAWMLVGAGAPVVGGLVAALLAGREFVQSLALHQSEGLCSAWDAKGRPLRIEIA